jgi:hypothetical protein
MRLGPGSTPGAVPLLARLALFALMFQIFAIDHHAHSGVEDVYGVPGTSQHALHCHGNAQGCVNGGMDMPMTVAAAAIVPVPDLSAFFAPAAGDSLAPIDAAIPPESKPPRI